MEREASTDGPIARRKDPRYTGENRCLPCTVVNVVIALLGSALVGASIGGPSPRGLGVGVSAFVLSVGLIYLRGYLVPGTPWLTRRFLPERILAWFDDHDEHPVDEDVDPEQVFCERGIVEDLENETDLTLNSDFENAWIEAFDRCAATTEDLRLQLADAIDVDPAEIRLERLSKSYEARYDEMLFASWESKAACQADVAAAAIMPRFDRHWTRRSFETQSELLGALRLFLEVCPTCRGTVLLDHEVVRSCCSERDVVAATCQGCDARVFEVSVDVDRLAPVPSTAELD